MDSEPGNTWVVVESPLTNLWSDIGYEIDTLSAPEPEPSPAMKLAAALNDRFTMPDDPRWTVEEAQELLDIAKLELGS